MGYKRFTASEKILKPDAKYQSKLVSKFINCMMWDGKKSITTKIFYDCMSIIEKKIKDAPPLEVFETAIGNVKPDIEVRSKRVGGANYQVPMPVNPKRRQSLAIRWVLDAVRSRSGKSMAEKLADEIDIRLFEYISNN